MESEVARKDMKKLQNEETKCKKTIIDENPCGCRERERESYSLVDALAQSKSWIKTLTTSVKHNFTTNIEQMGLHNSVSLFVLYFLLNFLSTIRFSQVHQLKSSSLSLCSHKGFQLL